MSAQVLHDSTATPERTTVIGAVRPNHAVEGDPPSREFRRMEIRILVPLAVVLVAAVLVWMYLVEGIIAVLINLVIVASLYVFGWWPYFGAVILRHKAHED